MKLIGVLGGMSWPSTILPYRLLNREVESRLGPRHSARIALYSIDYHAIRTAYSADWSIIPALLRGEIETLLSFRPDCWMIANNTLHKVYDEIAADLPAAPPLFHAITLVRAELRRLSIGRVLLLGTRFTMEDGYYADPLRRAGIEVATPPEPERERIGAILTRLADGAQDPAFADYFARLTMDHAAQGCEAVILACTELPLVVVQARSALAIVDPLVLQCRACVGFAVGDSEG